ncbi:ATP-binding protein [Streptacidiphilus sp. N1-3]|uniref:ATP-binding protein n=1 Tax=Streptacidiphilus alkalitolerans TaxID=3342712 RepID=A0ABV6WWJ4_9ACTN
MGRGTQAMAHKILDITPTPDVLYALTRTPITPLDALSELIDNAIDSFRAGEMAGKPSLVRQVLVDIPGSAEVSRGEGLIRVRDTGVGLTEDQIADAMRAGYSTKNHFDTLGLFGMGFNIATGKLGRTTRVVSARSEDQHAVEVTLDLPALIQNRAFAVTAERIPKPPGLEHGTVVEIRGWWNDGDQNSGFIRDLAKMTKQTLRDRIGRRYATLLRAESGNPVHISVNQVRCVPFEHCVWSAERFVTTQKYGNVPARINFDEIVDRARRCLRDGAEFGAADTCPRCGSADSRPVVHRVHGWVGIQRFDDQDDFGIDLIRNGRAIRVADKTAFFEYTDEATGAHEREYPIDTQYGRIIGEVHLDQVPVDFQKQTFQQATPEWQAAMRYLRGGSLIPSKWPDGEVNETPVSRLFQAYRRVRKFGRGDMYMGQYDVGQGKATRISRTVERDYYQRFLNREPGYYDDAKWWQLVETAGEPPIEVLPECQECGFQNARDAEICANCAYLLDAKPCASPSCGESIARSAVSCSHCGASQVPKIEMPWACAFCTASNKAGDERCTTCNSLKGAPHPASPEALATASEERPDLGASRLTVTLANGKSSAPLDVAVRSVFRPITPAYQLDPVPLVTTAKPGQLSIHVDLTHTAFTALGLRPEFLIATEAALYLYALHANLAGKPGHSIAALTAEVLKQGWGDAVTENADTVKTHVKSLFNLITDKVVDAPGAEDFYTELDDDQQSAMAESMIKASVDLTEFGHLKASGAYLRYCDRDILAAFFNHRPQSWFDGRVWSDPWPDESVVGHVVAQRLHKELRLKYLRCLEDCASYLRYEQPERLIVVRARAAAEFLSDHLS